MRKKPIPHVEFTVAYNAYREAMEASQYPTAVLHAERARELGELVFADNDEVMASLALNQGHCPLQGGFEKRRIPGLEGSPQARGTSVWGRVRAPLSTRDVIVQQRTAATLRHGT